MSKCLLTAVSVGYLALASHGCSSLDKDACLAIPQASDVQARGDHRQYVVSTLRFVNPPSEGLNLDDDPRCTTESAFTYAAAGLTRSSSREIVDEAFRAFLRSGAIIQLFDVRAASLENAVGVHVHAYHGVDVDGDPSDNLSGGETFGIDMQQGDGLITGRIDDGTLLVGGGVVPIAIALPELDAPFVVDMSSAAIVARVSATGLDGQMAGRFSESELHEVIVPKVREWANIVIARDCSGTIDCESGSAGEWALNTYDKAPEDGVVTTTEVRDSWLARELLAFDVDLYDENGIYCQRCDGVKESLSVAFKFSAVPANAPLPAAPNTRKQRNWR